MGDLRNLTAVSPTSLPPGFYFFPTQEQLFCYYLSNKNNFSSVPSTSTPNVFPFGFDVIKEIEFYDYSPFDLPEIDCKSHWYCFTTKVASKQGYRKARGGFWKSKGPAQVVFGENENTVLGTLEAFVFYREDSLHDVETDWVMCEYALLDRHKDSFVLCRVFLNSYAEKKLLEHAEESDAKKCDVKINGPYKQHDGTSTSGIGEVVVHNENFIDTGSGIPKFPMKLINEFESPIVTEPVSDDFFPSLVCTPQPDERVRPSEGIATGRFTFADVSADELIINSSILQGDFIELDDLIFPLSGFESLE